MLGLSPETQPVGRVPAGIFGEARFRESAPMTGSRTPRSAGWGPRGPAPLQLEAESLPLRGRPSFLFRPSTDRTRPTHTAEGSLLRSAPTRVIATHGGKTLSRQHQGGGLAASPTWRKTSRHTALCTGQERCLSNETRPGRGPGPVPPTQV